MSSKQGGSKKHRRAAKNARIGTYVKQAIRTKRNKLNQSLKREKQHKFFEANPDKGSPSQIRNRCTMAMMATALLAMWLN